MPYLTSAIRVRSANRIFSILRQTWKDKEKSREAKNFLEKFFPKVKIPKYDLYFRFPKRSLVCIKKLTSNVFGADCYSTKIDCCASDFSVMLRRLSDIGFDGVDFIGFETEPPSKIGSFLYALIPGGVLLFLIPVMGQIVVPDGFRLTFYVSAAILYTGGAALYRYRRMQ